MVSRDDDDDDDDDRDRELMVDNERNVRLKATRANILKKYRTSKEYTGLTFLNTMTPGHVMFPASSPGYG